MGVVGHQHQLDETGHYSRAWAGNSWIMDQIQPVACSGILLEHSHIHFAYGCFCTTIAELSCYITVHRTLKILTLVLYGKKNLPAPNLEDVRVTRKNLDAEWPHGRNLPLPDEQSDYFYVDIKERNICYRV